MTELNEPLRWLEREALNIQFGIVALSVIIHAGKIKRVEKTLTTKEQLQED